MNPKIKALWIEALDSGKYPKGLYQLQDLDNKFDTLGVLCEIAVEQGIIPQPARCDQKGMLFFGYKYGAEGDVFVNALPKAVCEWAGIEYRTAYRIGLLGDKTGNFNKVIEHIKEKC